MEAEKLNFLLFKRLSAYSGQSFENMLKISERDNWLNSDQAKSFGLIDNIIGVNENTPSITDQLEGFDDYYSNYVAPKILEQFTTKNTESK
jgi:hypothetical protein